MEHANGNPFMSKEIARSLYKRRGSKELAFSGENVLESAVMQRFDEISPTHQAVLKTASVIGNEFLLDQLLKILPRSITRNASIAECLAELRDDDWIEKVNPEPNVSYEFQHDLLRHVVYNLNLASKQKYIHLSTAHYVEKQFFEDLRPYFTLLTYHYRKAGDKNNTMKYLMYSLRDSIAMEAMEEAIHFIDKALLLDPGEKLLGDLLDVVREGHKFHLMRVSIFAAQSTKQPKLIRTNTARGEQFFWPAGSVKQKYDASQLVHRCVREPAGYHLSA